MLREMSQGKAHLLLIVAAVTLACVSSSCLAIGGGCGNELVNEIRSPGGKSKAVVFQRDCGASTGFSTQMSILDAGERLSNRSGNIFVADTDHGKSPAGAWGGPEVEVRWLDDDHLFIRHDSRVRVFRAEQTFGSVQIRYEKDASGDAPNNGMHPTADTNLVVYLQRCGAAGDA